MHLRMPCRAVALILTYFLLGSAPAGAQISGLNYTLTPGIDRVFSDDASGLEPHFAPYLRVGIGFGSYVTLAGSLSRGRNVDMDPGGVDGVSDAVRQAFLAGPVRTAAVDRYAAVLQFHLNRRRVSPFVAFGTGIRRVEPDGLPATESILVSGAVGIKYRLWNRVALTVQASSEAYRYVPATTFLTEEESAALEPTDFERVTARDYALGVGLTVFLGGRPENSLTAADRAMLQRVSSGLRGLTLVVEPFVGTISFDRDLDFPRRQTLAGVHVGVDLGPYVGLRGLYWRGVSGGSPVTIDDLQALGGEIKLNFSTDYSGMRPFVSLGGGILDVREGYTGRAGTVPDDQPFAMAGAGVQLPLSRTLVLHGAARSLLIAGETTGSVSDPGSVSSSWLLSAGVSIGIGGGKSPAELLREAEAAESARRDALALDRQRTLEAALEAAERRADSLASTLAAAERPIVSGAPPQAGQQAPGEIQSWMSIPVPREGEIYIRFGTPPPGSTRPGGSRETLVLDPETGTYRRSTEAGAMREVIREAALPDSTLQVADEPSPDTPETAPAPAQPVPAAPAETVPPPVPPPPDARPAAVVAAPTPRAAEPSRINVDSVAAGNAVLADLARRIGAAEARAEDAEDAREAAERRLRDELSGRERDRIESHESIERLERQIERLETALDRVVRDARDAADRREREAEERAEPVEVPALPVPVDSSRSDTTSTVAMDPARRVWNPFRPSAIWGSIGYTFTVPHNAVMTARIEIARTGSRVFLLPGIAVGAGSDTRVAIDGLVGAGVVIPSAGDLSFFGAAGPSVQFGGDATAALSVRVGASYPVIPGRVYVEFGTENLADQTQLSIGVRRQIH